MQCQKLPLAGCRNMTSKVAFHELGQVNCTGYKSQLITFTAESRVTCLPYQPAVTGSVARIDTHTLALLVKNRQGADCVAILDIKNRLELCSHVVDTVRF
jgi:hypothetical protein